MTTRPIFVTSDLRHGAWLIARGVPYLGADDGTGRLRFSFQCSSEEAAAYLNGDDSVSARKLFAAWRTLRDEIDCHRNGENTMNRSRADASAYR